ncbi:MAG TPA: hypothetical protein PKA13_06675, partial [Geminicoccaceae bacterium]|nr:hypothetical protein [Geminicoccus sp.]HMU49442.1 hypothetical protein [Geminicoccaceae bacterium]
MFDRLACLPMRLASRPGVDLAALLALRTLLASTVDRDPGGQRSSHAPFLNAARESCDQKRGDAHATPAQPFVGASGPRAASDLSESAAIPNSLG